MRGKSLEHMRRRTFLAVLAAGVFDIAAENAGNEAPTARGADMSSTRKPKMTQFRHWMHGLGDEPKSTAQALKDAGFDCVVAAGAENIEAVNSAGMESWLCGGAFGLGSLAADDGVKAVDVAGETRVWFGSGCPNNPGLRKQNLGAYDKMAATPGVKGILVDGCRFASPASGLDAFLTCFCDACRAKADELGLDFDAMKRDVAALRSVVTG